MVKKLATPLLIFGVSILTLLSCQKRVEDASVPGLSFQAPMQLNWEALRTGKTMDEAYWEDMEEFIFRYEGKTPDWAKTLKQGVLHWVDGFLTAHRGLFQRYLQRGEGMRSNIEETLQKSGLPQSLYYLPLIESGYRAGAASSAQAVGVWQFIGGTAKRYGLKVTREVDERRDVFRATRAASQYLGELHTVFESWYLALAAYNAGENRVLREVMKGGTKDFFVLSENKAWPEETRQYVPKFVASVLLGRNADRFGFVDRYPRIPEDLLPNARAVRVPSPLPLKTVARLAGVDLKDLKKLNPQLVKGITPLDDKEYELWVPSGLADSVDSVRSDLQKIRTKLATSLKHRYGVRKKAHRRRR